MTPDEADRLIKRLYYYETNSHFDGYDVTLDEYYHACHAYPITMRLAVKRYEHRGRPASTHDFSLKDVSPATELERIAIVFAIDFVDRMMQTPEGGWPRAITDHDKFTYVLACQMVTFAEKAGDTTSALGLRD